MKTNDHLTQAGEQKKRIILYMMRNGVPRSQLAEDLIHWSNTAFLREGELYDYDNRRKYYVADRLIDIYTEDRFLIFKCEICQERTIISNLNDDEKTLFDNPNEPDIEELSISNEKICADCQAARDL
jgi:hypothetical protein